ncbi:MAG: TAXI family TRAP transporter solute-binding subunit [Proteobacteria bacterium]|nr:TAXI family TRAP transporter solute-binding subunit [Pseudomonadota bacterium]
MKKIFISFLSLMFVLSINITNTLADKLPKNIAWTAYGTTSSGYAQSVGLGQMLKKHYDVDLRIIPGKNDVSRMVPLKAGQAEICSCGIASYFAQEGIYMFGEKKWGPMKLYNIFNNIGRNGQMLATAADANIKTMADLKGKRVTWVKGSPALNGNTAGFLAFGGLTWNDVKKVETSGWGASANAVINGQADATMGSTVGSIYNKLNASPRGLFFPSMPHSDDKSWTRALATAPHFNKTKITNFIGSNDKKKSFEGNNYPYPIFVTLEKTSSSLTYELTKAVMNNYDNFKDAGPGMDGYQLSNQNLNWVFPYHPGAVKLYKEKGVWTAKQDAHNKGLLKRQDVLANAWANTLKENLSDDGFNSKWLKNRASALKAAGMAVPFN